MGRDAASPLVSIVIPTRNRARLLSRAIESALGQAYPNVEVVVVDDGSTDGTRQVLAAFDGRVEALTLAHSGTGAARNAGWRRARGDFIAFLDDDDTLLPEAVARRADLLRARPEVGVVYSDLYVVDETGRLLGRYSAERGGRMPSGDVYEALLPRNFIPTHAILWRRAVLEHVGGFPERAVGEDWECILKAAESYRFQYLDEPLGHYRLHPGNISHDRAAMVEGYGIVQRQVALSERFGRLPAPRRARILVRYAAQQWLEGDRELGRTFLRMATTAAPLSPWTLSLRLLTRLGQPLARRLVRLAWRLRSRLHARPTATDYFRERR